MGEDGGLGPVGASLLGCGGAAGGDDLPPGRGELGPELGVLVGQRPGGVRGGGLVGEGIVVEQAEFGDLIDAGRPAALAALAVLFDACEEGLEDVAGADGVEAEVGDEVAGDLGHGGLRVEANLGLVGPSSQGAVGAGLGLSLAPG